jgi:hypothetical protein
MTLKINLRTNEMTITFKFLNFVEIKMFGIKGAYIYIYINNVVYGRSLKVRKVQKRIAWRN